MAALNQPIDAAAAAPFALVIDRILERRDASALGLAVAPLADLYAMPARAFVESRGGAVEHGRAAVIGAWPSTSLRCASATTDLAARHHLRRAVARPALRVLARAAAAGAGVRRGRRHAGVADRDRQPVADRPVTGRRSWGCRAGPCSGCSTSSGCSATRVAPVARVERCRGRVARSNDELVALAVEELPRPAGGRPAVVRRAVVVRERKATFSVAPGVPSRPPVRTAIPGLSWPATGSETTSRLPSRARSSAAMRPRRGRALPRAVTGHLRRPLPGDRTQGKEPALVPRPAGAQPAPGGGRSARHQVNALMGRMEGTRPVGAPDDVADRIRHTFGIANFSLRARSHRSRRHRRRGAAISATHLPQLPGVGAAGRQRYRCRRRRSSARSADGSRRRTAGTSISRGRRSTSASSC